MTGGVVEGRVAAVRELRAQGLTYPVIAGRLGISLGYARRLGSTKAMASTRLASREAKRRRRGVCVDCKAVTRYNGHDGRGTSERCSSCANREIGLAQRGSGEVGRSVLEFCSVPRRYVEIREHLGRSESYISSLLYQRLLPYGLIRRVRRGVYVATGGPSGGSVVTHHSLDGREQYEPPADEAKQGGRK